MTNTPLCCRPLMIDDGFRMLRFYPENFYFVRADGNYCNVFDGRNHKKPVCTLSYKIGKLYDILAKWGYVRVNRSELVNCAHVMQIYGNIITLTDGTEMKITKLFRDDVIAHFEVMTEKRKSFE